MRIVSNAGGLNPAGLAERLREVARGLGLDPAVAHVEGDDLRSVAGRSRGSSAEKALTANAYLGGFGIAAALRAGADVVVTGRVTDASLVVGAAVAHHGWSPDGVRRAGRRHRRRSRARVRLPGDRRQLLRLPRPRDSISRPAAGLPRRRDRRRRVERDHQARRHRRRGHPRHRDGAAGLRDPVDALPRARRHHASRHDQARAGRPRPGGDHRHARRGAAAAAQGLRQRAGRLPQLRRVPAHRAATSTPRRSGSAPSSSGRGASAGRRRSCGTSRTPATPTRPAGTWRTSVYRCVVRDPSPDVAGKGLTGPAVELALASYPGFTLTGTPTPATPYGVYRPAYVDRAAVTHTVVHADGRREVVPDPPGARRHDR